MNKYEEALDNLDYIITKLAYWSALDLSEVDKEYRLYNSESLIKELVDRATPKKPIIKQSINGSFDWEKEEIINYHVCPNGCKQVRDEYVDKFCSECGQAIDWRDKNE